MLEARSPRSRTNLFIRLSLPAILLALAGVTPTAALPQAPSRQTASSTAAAKPLQLQLRVGQRIEGWITVEWLPVTLVQIGGGPWADSPYLVEYGQPIGGIQPKRWLSAKYVRPLSKPEPPPPPPPAVRVGDRVEAWITAEWLPVKLVQIGGGPWADSPYLVEYGTPIGGIQPKRWLSARYVRPLAKTPPDTSAAGPRLGRYVILSYGTPSNPLRLGEIELVAGGAYRYYANGGRVLGTGTYRFDATKRAVVWQDGILKEQGWTGTFTVERNGKTHQIRLMRTTIAVNSVD